MLSPEAEIVRNKLPENLKVEMEIFWNFDIENSLIYSAEALENIFWHKIYRVYLAGKIDGINESTDRAVKTIRRMAGDK